MERGFTIAAISSFFTVTFAAFTIFCIGEYAIIALNAAFWAVVLLEFSRHFEGIELVSLERNDKAPETPPSKNCK